MAQGNSSKQGFRFQEPTLAEQQEESKEYVQNVFDDIEEVRGEEEASLAPLLFIVAETREGHFKKLAVSVGQIMDEQRHEAFRGLGKRLVAEGLRPIGLTLAAEAWMSILTEEEERLLNSEGHGIVPRPSEAKGRFEVVIVTTIKNGRENGILSAAKIKRGPQGAAALDEWEENEPGGTMQSLLLKEVFKGAGELLN